jgi:hypothetical protein
MSYLLILFIKFVLGYRINMIDSKINKGHQNCTRVLDKDSTTYDTVDF